MATLEVIYGCMFSGKTTLLINKFNELSKTNKCLAINYIFDKRYTNSNKIVSHTQDYIDCICIKDLKELTSNYDNLVKFNDAQYIFINEAQFFTNLKNWVLYVKNTLNKNVILCGLDLDFKRKQFGEIMDLIIYANKTFRMQGQCNECGNSSLYTHRIVNNNDKILIGTKEYIPLCNTCWIKANKTNETNETNEANETNEVNQLV